MIRLIFQFILIIFITFHPERSAPVYVSYIVLSHTLLELALAQLLLLLHQGLLDTISQLSWFTSQLEYFDLESPPQVSSDLPAIFSFLSQFILVSQAG